MFIPFFTIQYSIQLTYFPMNLRFCFIYILLYTISLLSSLSHQRPRIVVIYSYSKRFFHINVTWWSFSGVRVTARLLTSPGLFSVFWPISMVSTHPISKSSSPFINPLVTVPGGPITIGIIVTFIFQGFFNSLARLRYFTFFLDFFNFFNFFLWSAGTANSTILQVLFFFF